LPAVAIGVTSGVPEGVADGRDAWLPKISAVRPAPRWNCGAGQTCADGVPELTEDVQSAGQMLAGVMTLNGETVGVDAARLAGARKFRLSGASGTDICVDAFIGVNIDWPVGDGAGKAAKPCMGALTALSGRRNERPNVAGAASEPALLLLEPAGHMLAGDISLVGELSASGVGSRLSCVRKFLLFGAWGQTSCDVAFMGVTIDCEVEEGAGNAGPKLSAARKAFAGNRRPAAVGFREFDESPLKAMLAGVMRPESEDSAMGVGSRLP